MRARIPGSSSVWGSINRSGSSLKKTRYASFNVVPYRAYSSGVISDISSIMRQREEEAAQLSTVPRHKPFFIRLDGSCFGTFIKRTPGFQLPWDIRIHNAMMLTARDLMVFLTPAAVYTCSDELTAIFMPPAERSCYPYAGRVQKVVSISAGYISARFNYHINQQDYSTEPALGEKTADMKMYFDSRIGVVDNAEELFENLRWRQTDCIRNSKTTMGYVYLSGKKLKNVPANEVVRQVEEKTGHRWSDQPDWYRNGVLLKRNLYTKRVMNSYTQEMVEATRSRVVTAPALLHNPENVDALVSDYVDEEYLTKESVIVEEDYDFGSLHNSNSESRYYHA